MSIASATSKSGPYAGNGVTTVFAVAFACFATADLNVVRTDALGTDTVLTITTDYAVSLNADQTNSPGGTVTMVVAPPTGNQLTILRNVAATQGTQLPNQGGWYPQVVERALDKLTMLVQQLSEKASRSVQVGVTGGDPSALVTAINSAATTSTAAASSASSSATAASSSATAAAASAAGINLPAIAGNALKALRAKANESGLEYFDVGNLFRSPRTANAVLTAADKGSIIDVTAGTFTQTLTAAATLGNGWYCWYRNSGTGVVTLDPNGIETIDALATRNSYGQECILLFTDGANFFTEVVHPFYFKPAATATYVMPSGYLEIESDLVGASGGGGSGRRGAVSTTRSGGAPGGAPGRVVRRHRNIAAGTSITLTFGAAGTGGAAQTVNDTNGIDGTAGGNTTFGTLSTAYGGVAGKGGSNNGSSCGSTTGSGSLSAGTSTNSNGTQFGGLPRPNSFGTGTTNDNVGTGGAGSPSQTTGGNSEWGGAGSGSADPTATVVSVSGSSLYGVSAAGIGGHITSSDTMPANAGTAGLNGTNTVGGGAPGGTCGAAPTAGTAGAAATTDDACGNSGGGGGSSITAAAAAGGAGGFPGGAGGGGGASLNGFNSGPGGAGANGRGIIKGVI